jgi:CheY-like chemotaxis protein
VLLTDAPQQHRTWLDAMRTLGVHVALACDAHEALALLDEPPTLALIDLGAPAVLTTEVVAQLNARSSASLVIALHHGALDATLGEMTRLRVDGFCHAAAWDTAAFADLARPNPGSPFAH